MRLFIILFISISLAGCGRVSETTIKEILEKDPSFEKALNEKKRITAKITALRTQMEPKIREMTKDIQGCRTEYKLKQKDLKTSLAKLKNIARLLNKKKELSLSADEISVWNKRKNQLEREINSLQKELDKLRNKIRILATELKILKE